MIESDRVEKIYLSCLLHDDEIDDDGNPEIEPITVQGIMFKTLFHPKRVEENKVEIVLMLEELPTKFRSGHGGGWSFLNLCNTKNNEQWTGLHQRMDQLVQLGMAINKVKIFPEKRELWQMFPGGAPYITIS